MEDEREVELSSIIAIFPEIVLDAQDPFSASIDLPVKPSSPVTVLFPAPSDGTPPQSTNSAHENVLPANGPRNNVELHHLSYLPSLQLHINLPEGYPEKHPPKFELSTTPPWLSQPTLEQLQADGERMWEEFGHGQVVFAYIDHLQQSAENAFGMMADGETLEIPQDYKISLLDYDIKATQAAFEKETFDCGVCLGKFDGHGPRLSANFLLRSKERLHVPQNDRLRACILRSVSAGLL
jgi:E3 ubiquitin-protein ligase RNF14